MYGMTPVPWWRSVILGFGKVIWVVTKVTIVVGVLIVGIVLAAMAPIGRGTRL